MEEDMLFILETIKKKCEIRHICNGCAFHDINYGCLLNSRPDMWGTDYIRENVNKQ